MDLEFQRIGPNEVTSSKGFTVKAIFARYIVEYRDDFGEARIDCELMARPPGIILYKIGFGGMAGSRVDAIFSNVVRAIEYLGHRVEVWSTPSG